MVGAAAILLVAILCGGTFAAAAEPMLLFSDDFSSLAPEWGKESELRRVADKHLIMSLKPNLIHNSLYGGRKFRDVDLRVGLQQESGDTNETAGVIFWAEDINNYYCARISSDGKFLLTRKMRGKWLNPVNTRSETVVKSLKEWNEFRIITSGRMISVTVNGKEMARLEGFPPAEESRIGLFVESGEQRSQWLYRNVQVYSPPAAGPEAPVAADLLFADRFDVMSPVWGGANDVQTVRGGAFRVALSPDLVHRNHFEGALVDDSDVRVTIKQQAGETDQPAGLIFWSEKQNYVAFLLRSNGELSIRRVRAGQKAVVNDLNKPKGFREGLNSTNELKVVTTADRAELFVNGASIAKYKGFPPENGSQVGLLCESGKTPCEWLFDNFEVRSVTSAPSTAGDAKK